MNGNEYLKQEIKRRGLTQAEVARITGLSQTHVSMHIGQGVNRRGIGVVAAMKYHLGLKLSLRKLLKRD